MNWQMVIRRLVHQSAKLDVLYRSKNDCRRSLKRSTLSGHDIPVDRSLQRELRGMRLSRGSL